MSRLLLDPDPRPTVYDDVDAEARAAWVNERPEAGSEVLPGVWNYYDRSDDA